MGSVSGASRTITVTSGVISAKNGDYSGFGNSISMSDTDLYISGETFNCMFGGAYTIQSLTGGSFNFNASNYADAETALKNAMTSGSTITINGEAYTKE